MRGQLITASISVKTRQSYERFWSRFSHFVSKEHKQASCLPTTFNIVSLFLAHLFTLNFAPSTISGHLSAISFYHQINGFPDPCSNSLIKRMLLGCRKLRSSPDSRLPILSEHILKLLHAVKFLYHDNRYRMHLYSAIILVAFHGFFRMGELLPHNKQQSAAVVQLWHVTCHDSSINIQLHFHKTKKVDKPTTIIIQTQPTHCPVDAMRRYLLGRGSHKGPLFISSTNAVITLSHFRTVFRKLLSVSKLSTTRYSLHSFRIGACTQAIMSGASESAVMQMGRWRSYAFKRYIRLPQTKLPN